MHERFRDEVEFLVVYIKEAHPEDGWVLQVNRDDGITVQDARSSEERVGTAEACAVRHALRMPLLVDGMDNEVARQYGGWPDRLYLIGRDGRVAYQGGEGHWGFKPDELEAAIEEELGLRD